MNNLIQFKFFQWLLKKIHLLDILKFWVYLLYQKASRQNSNLYQTNLRKKHAFINLYFFLNQMNCEIIAEGKLGEDNKNFPIYITSLDNIWGTFLNEIFLSPNLNGVFAQMFLNEIKGYHFPLIKTAIE